MVPFGWLALVLFREVTCVVLFEKCVGLCLAVLSDVDNVRSCRDGFVTVYVVVTILCCWNRSDGVTAWLRNVNQDTRKITWHLFLKAGDPMSALALIDALTDTSNHRIPRGFFIRKKRLASISPPLGRMTQSYLTTTARVLYCGSIVAITSANLQDIPPRTPRRLLTTCTVPNI